MFGEKRCAVATLWESRLAILRLALRLTVIRLLTILRLALRRRRRRRLLSVWRLIGLLLIRLLLIRIVLTHGYSLSCGESSGTDNHASIPESAVALMPAGAQEPRIDMRANSASSSSLRSWAALSTAY